jgi:hypothetical protein
MLPVKWAAVATAVVIIASAAVYALATNNSSVGTVPQNRPQTDTASPVRETPSTEITPPPTVILSERSESKDLNSSNTTTPKATAKPATTTSTTTKNKTRSRVKPGMTVDETPSTPAPTPAAGDTIRFATNTWRVLAVSKTDLFVLSDTLVADKPFADTPTNTYATSTIRTWLTGDYLSTTFTAAEQKTLKPTPLPDVNVTADKVFLLSTTEFSDLLTDPTADTTWWLRTPDSYADAYATAVTPDGTFSVVEPHTQPLAVRPALTLDTTKLELRPDKSGLFIASPK